MGLHPDTERILGIKLNSDLRPEFPLSQADLSGPIDLLGLSEEEKEVFQLRKSKDPVVDLVSVRSAQSKARKRS